MSKRSLTKRILIVDDESELRELLCEILEFEGISTVQAVHGLHALQILSVDRDFDLILLDWNMPVMNGDAVIQYLQELNLQGHQKVIPVIVMSANMPTTPGGKEHYLEKPFSITELVKAILRKIKSLS